MRGGPHRERAGAPRRGVVRPQVEDRLRDRPHHAAELRDEKRRPRPRGHEHDVASQAVSAGRDDAADARAVFDEARDPLARPHAHPGVLGIVDHPAQGAAALDPSGVRVVVAVGVA